MNFCCVNRTICEANCRDASQFSPTTLAVDPLQSLAIGNPATLGYAFDRRNVADELKIHAMSVPEPPSVYLGPSSFSALRSSEEACMFIQNCGFVPKNLASRRAVSAVIARRFRTMSLTGERAR